MYKWNGETFEHTRVDAPEGTHAKEILAVDLDGSGRATLFAAIEARTEARGKSTVVVEPVRIKVYDFDGDRISSRVVATLDDRQCRFLSPGDVDGDGTVDIVAAGMNSGLWILRQQPGGKWAVSQIDAESSGYEHATVVADLEGDGQAEIYVASDRQRELRCYRWEGDHFAKEVIAPISPDEITFNLAAFPVPKG